MKILEVCPYSAGICGVFSRVLTESQVFINMGHEVKIFSSNGTKGSKIKSQKEEEMNNIKITRFPYMKLGGESFMYWNYTKEALEYSPDIIIVHNYRHLHTTRALKIKKKLEKQGKQCKVILVTHAPFVKNNSTRTGISSMIVKAYDKYVSPRTLDKFDAIVRICDWEIEYLKELGLDVSKTRKISNVLPGIYFDKPKEKSISRSILFLGRVSPIKNIEFIYELANLLPGFNFSIVGPIEENYMKQLSDKYPILPKNLTYYPAIYDIDKKIKTFDMHKYFILPSHREAMPQAMMEAMSRGMIIVSTNTDGANEIIDNGENGYICKNNTPEEARDIILECELSSLNSNDITDSIYYNYSIDKLKEEYRKIFESK